MKQKLVTVYLSLYLICFLFPEKFSDPRRKDGLLVYLRLVISVFYFHYLFFKDVSVKKGEPICILLKKEMKNLCSFFGCPCVIAEKYSLKIWVGYEWFADQNNYALFLTLYQT